MIVMKFGGSSLADPLCLEQVRRLVEGRRQRRPLVVVSAMGDATDRLIAMAIAAREGEAARCRDLHRQLQDSHRSRVFELFADDPPAALVQHLNNDFETLRQVLHGILLLGELSPRSRDAVTSIGELCSARIVAAVLGAVHVDARQVVRTDDRHGGATPLIGTLAELAKKRIAPLLHSGDVVVTQGFVGADEQGVTTTLGRGGSDYSASLLGAALDAEEIQIWTDVEGVLTGDPRQVEGARPIAELSFAEAAELAAFGANVLHPATVGPARDADIPVTVRCTGRPDGAFSTLRRQVGAPRGLTAVASRGPIQVVTASSSQMLNQPGFLSRLFEVFARHRVSVDLVATAEVSVSLTVDDDVALQPIVEELSTFCRAKVWPKRAILALVGEQLKRTPGLASTCFAALGDINIEMVSLGANEINLSLVVRQEDVAVALQRLHGLFVPSAATAEVAQCV